MHACPVWFCAKTRYATLILMGLCYWSPYHLPLRMSMLHWGVVVIVDVSGPSESFQLIAVTQLYAAFQERLDWWFSLTWKQQLPSVSTTSGVNPVPMHQETVYYVYWAPKGETERRERGEGKKYRLTKPPMQRHTMVQCAYEDKTLSNTLLIYIM